MSVDDAARAAKIFGDLAEKLHRTAPPERPPVRTGRPGFDQLIDQAYERSQALSDAGIQLAASAAAEVAATIFEGRAP